MLQSLSSLEDQIDYLIVDTPAGASDSTLFFTSATDIPLIVLVAEPTSFLDAYAPIKAAHIEKGLTQFSVMVNMANSASSGTAEFQEIFRNLQPFSGCKADICRHGAPVKCYPAFNRKAQANYHWHAIVSGSKIIH